MKDDELFTLDEVLGGFSAKRTRLLLFQIEKGQSENLPALVKVSSGAEIQDFHLDIAGKQVILPLRDVVKKESKANASETDQLEVEVQLAGNTARKK
jgi:hypothetical protein